MVLLAPLPMLLLSGVHGAGSACARRPLYVSLSLGARYADGYRSSSRSGWQCEYAHWQLLWLSGSMVLQCGERWCSVAEVFGILHAAVQVHLVWVFEAAGVHLARLCGTLRVCAVVA